MKFDEMVNLIEENCPEVLRSCWKPVKADVPSRSWHATKFGGSNPFRGTNFSWPRCANKECGRQKSFICQINLGELPGQVKTHIGKDSGLFQCFWCTVSSSECSYSDRFADPPTLNGFKMHVHFNGLVWFGLVNCCRYHSNPSGSTGVAHLYPT